MSKCLTTKCVRPEAPSLQRGLCMICFSRAKKMVEANETTWAELVELNMALSTEDPFTEAFNKAKEGELAPSGATTDTGAANTCLHQ